MCSPCTMFIDVVMPSGNEKEFVEMAQRLGISGLIFLYPKKQKLQIVNDGFPVYQGITASGKGCMKLKRDALVYAAALEPEKAQAFLEQGRADAVFLLEAEKKRDGMHYRRSGLNQVLCIHAREKEVHIGLALAPILRTKGWKRARLLGRMMQNLRFCRKFRTPIAVASLAESPWELFSPGDIRSLLLTLGASGKQANAALEVTAERMARIADAEKGIIRTKQIVSVPVD